MTLSEYANQISQILPEKISSLGNIPQRLLEAMEYSLASGGKRLRPALLMMTSDMLGGSPVALDFACAIEMIHTYSLIHDDLPAMDNDDYRRGRLTNHKVFGEGMAILAGDGLLSAAMQLMIKAACKTNDFSVMHAAEVIARRCGVTGMVAGQVMDIEGQGNSPTQESVQYIHEHKTADLIIAPIQAAAWLCHASIEKRNALIEFGYHLGIAFQITDDILDVTGDESTLGKKTGMDASLNKQTWVALQSLEGARRDAAEHINRAIQSLDIFGYEADVLRELALQTLHRDH